MLTIGQLPVDKAVAAAPRFALTLAAVLALAVGFSLTAGLYVAARQVENANYQAQFEQRADARINAVEKALLEAVTGLETINHLFTAVEAPTREQFRQFTRPLLERYPFVQAYEFHRKLAAAELPAYEARMRREFPGFQVRQMTEGGLIAAAVQPHYSVVDYIEPIESNTDAFGLDVALNRHLATVLMRAVDSGLPAATNLLRLAQAPGSNSGFLVMIPVYRKGARLDSIDARRAAVVGDTAAVFRTTYLVDQILGSRGALAIADMDLSLHASAQPNDGQLVFRHHANGGDAKVHHGDEFLLPHWLVHNHSSPVVRHFDVGGTLWRMEVAEPPSWIGSGSGSSLLVLVFGSLISLLTAAYLQNVTTRSRAIQRLVDRRTGELKEANALLREDIIARQQADQALRLRERVIETSANAILIIRAEAPDFPIDYVNPAFERITGYSATEMIGQNFRVFKTDPRDQLSIAEIKSALREKREAHVTIRNTRKDGTIFWNDIYIAPVLDIAGDVSHYVVTQYDVTSTKRYEAELEFKANRDVLTGLANRNLLSDRLRQAISYAHRYSHTIWVMFIDLDRFKVINESLGHKAGDLLLHQVGQRMSKMVREADTIARPGGDEFVLVMPQGAGAPLTAGIAQKVLDALAQPFHVEGHEFFVTASIGVAIYPVDGIDAEALIKHAEIAMYRAKELGRNNFQFYTPKMNQEALERLHLEASLRTALERNEFALHYQPQVDLRTGRIVGMEALIRWHHPQLGMVAPGRFITLAEETGLIVPIGAWVTATACRQAKAWQDAGLGSLRIAVNLSARQFYQHDLVESIAAVLDETGLAPGNLEIELTESLVMTDVESAITVLGALKTLGVKIAIDDFGTGYSSLSYLKRFPIDVLKIDQSFVRDISNDADDAAIVATIISLAHSLRLSVIAEGVETSDQLDYLRDRNCDQVQGYLISRPLPALAFAMLLQEGESLALREDAQALSE